MTETVKLTCDWHLHSHLSDGTASAEEMVVRAAELGLTSISITDHDCIEAHRDGELFRLLDSFFPDGVVTTRGSDSHSLAEWPQRLAALRRWDRMLPERFRIEGSR